MSREKRNAEILAAIEAASRQILAFPEVARDFLLQSGVYTKDGKIHADYGGEK